MNNIRIIPRIDIKGPNLVKGIHLEGLRVLGNPAEFARHYYESGADELLFVDVVASLYERNSLDDIISSTASEIFIPITVAGGIRTIQDIERILKAGADKVAINTAAIKNPDFIEEASKKFGSSTIVATLEVIRQNDGAYQVYTDNGREHTGIMAADWVKKVEDLGAGEIILTSVDKEGTGEGFDEELIKRISPLIDIPLIVHGGAGSKNDVLKASKIDGVNAVSMASILHYKYLEMKAKFDLGHHTSEGNLEFLKNFKPSNKFELTSIQEIKEVLLQNGLECRVTH